MEQKELNAISDLFKSEYDKLLKEINDKLTFAYKNADKLLEENNRLKTELAETNTKARELVELNLTNEMLIIDLKQQLSEKDNQFGFTNAIYIKQNQKPKKH